MSIVEQQNRGNRNIPSIFQMPTRRNTPTQMNQPQAKTNPPNKTTKSGEKKNSIGVSIPLLSHFKDEEGSYDIEKIMTTTQKVNEIYTKVSPIISNFRKK